MLDKNNQERKYFGYHCIFTPEEIIHATGFTPLRLFPLCEKKTYDCHCFHSRSCEFAKGILDNIQDGSFDFLHGMVFTQCCDALRSVYETVALDRSDVFFVNTPLTAGGMINKLKEELDVDFFMQEFYKFGEALADTYNVSVSKEALFDSIKIYQRNRSLLFTLEMLYKRGLLTTQDYFQVLRTGSCIRKEDHNLLLEKLISSLEKIKTLKKGSNGMPVLLVGGINANYGHWVEYFHDLGITIVSDDLCSFYRSFNHTENPVSSVDPYRFLVTESFQKRCPIKIDPNGFFNDLYRRYIACKAKGIIFMLFQYCDIQQLHYTELKLNLDKLNIPTLVLNPSIDSQHSAQIETRLEAFVEMVSNHE